MIRKSFKRLARVSSVYAFPDFFEEVVKPERAIPGKDNSLCPTRGKVPLVDVLVVALLLGTVLSKDGDNAL